jgi:transcriptional regulator with XRE-family HTH domain
MQRNLSQEKLAELADLHTNYIGSVERGERNVSVINLCKIARGAGVHPSELLKNQEV